MDQTIRAYRYDVAVMQAYFSARRPVAPNIRATDECENQWSRYGRTYGRAEEGITSPCPRASGKSHAESRLVIYRGGEEGESHGPLAKSSSGGVGEGRHRAVRPRGRRVRPKDAGGLAGSCVRACVRRFFWVIAPRGRVFSENTVIVWPLLNYFRFTRRWIRAPSPAWRH